MQLDLFENDPNLYLWGELQKTKDSLDNTRRGLFVRFNELERMLLEIKEELAESKTKLI